MNGAVSIAATIDERHFFELAATVMPIVLFGSVLARATQPPRKTIKLRWYHALSAVVLTLYITFVCAAEIFAIAVAVDGGAEQVIRTVVSVALVFGIFGFGLAVVLPWLNRFREAGRSGGVACVIFGLVFLVSLAWGSFRLIELTNNGTLQTNEERRLNRALRAGTTSELRWLRAEIQAHADHRLTPLEKRELTLVGRLKSGDKEEERRLLGINAR